MFKFVLRHLALDKHIVYFLGSIKGNYCLYKANTEDTVCH